MDECNWDDQQDCVIHQGSLSKNCSERVEAMHEELHNQLKDLHFWKCGCNGLIHKDVNKEWIIKKCKLCKESATSD